MKISQGPAVRVPGGIIDADVEGTGVVIAGPVAEPEGIGAEDMPGGALVTEGGVEDIPGGALVTEGGVEDIPGGALVTTGGAEVIPGGALVTAGAEVITTGALLLIGEGPPLSEQAAATTETTTGIMGRRTRLVLIGFKLRQVG